MIQKIQKQKKNKINETRVESLNLWCRNRNIVIVYQIKIRSTYMSKLVTIITTQIDIHIRAQIHLVSIIRDQVYQFIDSGLLASIQVISSCLVLKGAILI